MHQAFPPLAELSREIERRSVVQVLRANPGWSLLDLVKLAIDNPAIADTFADVKLSALGGACERRELAERCRGAEFDAFVFEVLRDVSPAMVGARYLREQLGGPRWKLTASLARLADAGQIRRTGRTCDRRYGAWARRSS